MANSVKAREYFDKQMKYAKQLQRDRSVAACREDRKKHLYTNPSAPIPDAKARIAEAIAQAERTERNIEALNDEGE